MIRLKLTCFLPLFVIELADQVLVLCFLVCSLLVGGFKLASEAIHFSRQLLIGHHGPFYLVEAPFSVSCSFHQVLHTDKLRQTARLHNRVKD